MNLNSKICWRQFARVHFSTRYDTRLLNYFSLQWRSYVWFPLGIYFRQIKRFTFLRISSILLYIQKYLSLIRSLIFGLNIDWFYSILTLWIMDCWSCVNFKFFKRFYVWHIDGGLGGFEFQKWATFITHSWMVQLVSSRHIPSRL